MRAVTPVFDGFRKMLKPSCSVVSASEIGHQHGLVVDEPGSRAGVRDLAVLQDVH
jgi:hypothetical protein